MPRPSQGSQPVTDLALADRPEHAAARPHGVDLVRRSELDGSGAVPAHPGQQREGVTVGQPKAGGPVVASRLILREKPLDVRGNQSRRVGLGTGRQPQRERNGTAREVGSRVAEYRLRVRRSTLQLTDHFAVQNDEQRLSHAIRPTFASASRTACSPRDRRAGRRLMVSPRADRTLKTCSSSARR